MIGGIEDDRIGGKIRSFWKGDVGHWSGFGGKKGQVLTCAVGRGVFRYATLGAPSEVGPPD